ncbi:N-acetylglucosamine-6-phosphate deacetylase [Clostridium isatidis]|uniref:N-acetylglucosamine-6-phosphate deacetylase n=1 Tax=Clostridium isatidis TaxID=182773 RepID=A0A343J9S3_9CLOT|nr:N-acetylglucosamine-6-phosphate deacetylase [Clostridium isatidis]ASW42281.1 N-acetylglucosamine-6-phosphate deacetylase [Clostridium isatidis]
MLIQSKRVWIADQFIPAQIEIDDNKIVNIYSYNEKEVNYDYGNKRIVPGFIDIHCHGAYGFDTNDADEQGLRNWTKRIVNEGVTALLATTITQSKEVLTKALSNVAKVVEDGYEGAEILGIHFEGPYLDMEYKGAQPKEYIVKPTIQEFQNYQKAAKGLIKYVTLATEVDEDYALTEYLYNNNIVVSIGHSASSYEEAVFAFAHGARSQTHVYNGMTPYNHRKNGLVGAALRIKGMYGEIICDGNHSTPVALYNFFNAKGPDYGIMVTDALMAKGFEPGSKFIFGGNEIEIYEDGSAHLVETKGLAGSTLKMNEGLRILVEDAMVPFNYAINSCTINPAKCLGVDKRKGRIGVGYDSDLVVLNDDYSVLQTYCLGKAML